MYKSAKWSAIDKVMAYTSIMLLQSGNVKSDSDEDKALTALNISMTTKIDRETVDALFAMSFENIWQPISEN